MIGSGVLLECLESPDVEEIVSITRRPTGVSDTKLTEVVHEDFLDYESVGEHFRGIDSCFFCLGVSAAGMSEESYRRITFDVTAAAAKSLREASPGATFVYVTGAGADGTGEGRVMWARVKGQIENHLSELGFPRAYMFRPALIQPRKGVTSSTGWYRWFYRLTAPLYPLLQKMSGYVTATDRVGQAMIAVAQEGYDKAIVENRDINELAARRSRISS